MAAAAILFVSCGEGAAPEVYVPETEISVTLEGVAGIMSQLPIEAAHLAEVHDAVSSSSGNGYDEEYMLSDLFLSPGSGVGSTAETKSSSYANPLRDLFVDYLSDNLPATKSARTDVEAYVQALTESGYQIYWPYSEDWDGETFPIITFDPGYGVESNYGYEVNIGPDGARVVDSVRVDESVAAARPVWVINRNDDSAFTPLDLFVKSSSARTKASGDEDEESCHSLKLESFKMLRNYDSWFAGASEFFVKCGAVDGFKASVIEDLTTYSPSVTDFMIVVKRRQKGKELPLDCMMLTDFTDQMDKIAFLVLEDDGGEMTSWKCEATVKYNSKSYGFDIELPIRKNDDIVWRGQLSRSWFKEGESITGRFGDVEITFKLE